MDKKIALFIQLLQIKRYSINSIDAYTNAFRQFLNYFSGADIDILKEKEIERFINEQVTKNNISVSYQKQLVAAIKFWYIGVLGRKVHLDYLYPDRGEFKVPVVFSQQEIKKMFAKTLSIKRF